MKNINRGLVCFYGLSLWIILLIGLIPAEIQAQRFVLEPGKWYSQDNNRWESRLLLKHDRLVRLDYSENLSGKDARLIIGRASNEYSHRSVPVSGTSVEFNPQSINLRPGRYYARITNSSQTRTSDIINDSRSDLVYSNEILLIIESPNAATIIGPRGSTLEGTPTFEWEAVPGVVAYWIIFSSTPFEIVTDENDDISVQGANLVWQFITDESTALYGDINPNIAFQTEAPPLNPGQEYSYAVLNLYEEDNPAFASAVFGGVIPMAYQNPNAIPRATLTAPANNTIFNARETITFSWTSVEQAESYTINLYEVVTQQGVDATIPIWSNTTTNTLIDYPALSSLKNSNYLWNVVANDGLGGGTTSGTSTSPNNKFTYRIPTGQFLASAIDAQEGSEITGIEINIRAISGGVTPNSPFLLQGSSLTDDLVAGRYELTAIKSGYADNVVVVDINEDRTSSVRFEMKPLPAFVSGRVVDENGVAVDRATVRLTDLDTQEVFESLTSSNGRFGVSMEAGDYRLTAQKNGYISPTSRNLIINPDEQRELSSDLRLRNDQADVSGYIMNDMGNPVQLARVTIEKDGQLQEVRSNSSGFYSFVVSSGNWILRASRTGFVQSDPKQLTVSVGDNLQNQNMTLVGRANQVTGFVREVLQNPDGSTGLAPFRNVTVHATPSSGSVIQSTTTSNGQFTLNLRSGTYQIRAVADNYSSSSAVEVVLGYGETLSGVDFQMTPNPSSVRGQVTLSDGTELSGVTVEIPGVGSATTNSAGRYTLSTPVGSYSVRASRSGYVASNPVDVSVSAGQVLDGINFTMSPNASIISGRVRTGGASLANAIVTARSNLGDVITRNTDEFGNYSMSMAPGTWNVTVSRSGYLTTEAQPVTLSAGQRRENLDFSMTPNTRIVRGTVTSGGEPLRNVTVRVTTASNPDISESTLTQVNGTYAFSLPAGVSYEIRSTMTGYRSGSGDTPVLVAGGDPLTVDLQMSPSPSSVSGRVRNQAQNPLENATVRLYDQNGNIVEETSANREGNYTLGAPGGSYKVSASKPGYLTAESQITISVGQNLTNVNLQMEDNFVVFAGRVLDSQGNPIENARVNLTPVAGPGTGASANTSQNGNFSFNRLVGSTYDIVISSTGYGTKRDENQVFVDGSQVSRNYELLAQAGAISGRITDVDGNSIPEASVTARNGNGETVRGTSSGTGQFQFSSVTIGSYQITADKTGYARSEPVEVTLTPQQSSVDSADITNLMPNNGVIQGVITDENTGAPVRNVNVTVTGEIGSGYAVTNNQGQYSITNLGLGSYDLTAQRDGYRTFRETVTVSPEQNEIKVDGVVALNDGIISGVVTNQQGNPLSVTIDLTLVSQNGNRYETRTDSEGNFRFNGVEPGVSYTMQTNVYGEGLNNATVDFDYPAGTPSLNLADAVVVRIDNGVIRGNTSTGNVPVQLIRSDTGEVLTTRQSEPDGSFRFQHLRERSYALVPTLSGYDFTPDTLLVSNLGFGQTREVSFEAVSNIGTLTADVQFTGGGSAEGVTVQIVSVDNGSIVQNTSTNATGLATFETPGNREYIVTASLDGYTADPIQRTVNVMPNQTSTTSFTLLENNSAISGRVTRSDNQNNLSDVLVRAVNQSSGSTTEAITAGNGTYHIESIAAGIYTVIAGRSGFQSESIENISVLAEEEVQNVDFSLEPSVLRFLEGYVTYRGEGVPNIPVMVQGRTEFNVTTNQNGQYIINNFPIRSGVDDTTLVEISIATETYANSQLHALPSSMIGNTFRANDFVLPSGQLIAMVTDGVNPLSDMRVRYGRQGSANITTVRTGDDGGIASPQLLRRAVYTLIVDTDEYLLPSRNLRVELESDTSVVSMEVMLPYQFSPVDSIEAGSSTLFTVDVTDGYDPGSVSGTLYYRAESRSTFQTVPFSLTDAGLTAEMPAQLSLEPLVYYIELEDAKNEIPFSSPQYITNPLAVNILSSISIRPNLVGQRLRVGDTYEVDLRIRDGENNSMADSFEGESGPGKLEVEITGDNAPFDIQLSGRKLTITTSEDAGNASIRVQATFEGQVFVETLDLRVVDRKIDRITLNRPAPRLNNEMEGTFNYAAFDTAGNRIMLGNSINWSVDPPGVGTVDKLGNFRPSKDVISEFRANLHDPISDISVRSEPVSLFTRLREDRAYTLSDGGDMLLEIPAGAIQGAADISLRLTVPEKPKKFVMGKDTDLSLTASDRIYRIRYSGDELGAGATLQIPEDISLQLFEGKRHIGRFDQQSLQWELFSTQELGSMYKISDFTQLGQFSLLAENEPLSIQRVGILPNPFSPVVAPVRIGYMLTSDAPPAIVTIRIYNLRGQLVRTLLEDEPQLPGRYGSRSSPREILWDGLTNDGRMANNGRYIMRIEVRDGRNQTSKLEQIVLIK